MAGRIGLLMMLLVLLGGCSIARTAAVQDFSKNAMFYPPNSVELAKRVDGLNGEFSFTLRLECPGSEDETVAFYLQKFSGDRWRVEQNSTVDGVKFLWFERKQTIPTFLDPIILTMDKVWIHLRAISREGHTLTGVELSFDGYYWWNWGNDVAHALVLAPFFWMGEGAEVIETKLWWMYAYW